MTSDTEKSPEAIEQEAKIERNKRLEFLLQQTDIFNHFLTNSKRSSKVSRKKALKKVPDDPSYSFLILAIIAIE